MPVMVGTHLGPYVVFELPEGMFLTSDGFVKVLDFGLAKLTRGEGAEAGFERTQTAAGVAMGTVGYLSPEQARGQEADARRTSSRWGRSACGGLSWEPVRRG